MLSRLDDFIVAFLSMLYNKNLFIFRILYYCFLVGVSLVCFLLIGEAHLTTLPIELVLVNPLSPKALGGIVLLALFLRYGLYVDSAAINTCNYTENWKFKNLIKLLKKH